jgi:hypothetical protein
MDTAAKADQPSKALLWGGWIASVLPALFLLLDGAMKLVKPDFVVKATVELGFAESVIVPLGIVLITCCVLYLIPRTAVLGAVLLVGYLGGAVATHVHAGHGAFENPVPGRFRSHPLGWTVVARSEDSRADTVAHLIDRLPMGELHEIRLPGVLQRAAVCDADRNRANRDDGRVLRLRRCAA